MFFVGKFQFVDVFDDVIVGAPNGRPRSEMLRIRIRFWQIRKIFPLRAADRRSYIRHRNNSINRDLKN